MVIESFQNVLAAAGACASRLGHSEVTVTHVTYVLCTTGALNAAFRKLGKDVKTFEDTLLDAMVTYKDFSPTSEGEMKMSIGLARCIDKAEKAAREFGRDAFTHDDFLVEALQSEHGAAADDYARKTFLLLSGRAGNTSQAARGTEYAPAGSESQTDTASATEQMSVGQQALSLWATDLVAAARLGELDEVFGRDLEVERLHKILARRKKSNPILVGEPGVGKTAVVEGLAVLIASGHAPAFLASKRIHALDIKGILAGTRNRGDLEERFKFILDAAAADPEIILFIDEIHTVMGAGGAMAGVADLMKPALASGKIKCIGATTSDEFARYFSADPAMVRRFQKVAVEEPGRDEAVGIVRMAAKAYESHHGITYSDAALVAAVDLSIRYLADRQLPDKALDLIDEAGASVRSAGRSPHVDADDVLRVVRDVSRDRFAGADDDSVWRAAADEMKSIASGRAGIIEAMMTFLRGVSSHPSERIGAKARFLLSGPQGAGKRHLAESLAQCLGVPLLVLDMSGYTDRSSVSSLIGAPPGYIGYDDGGKLTEFARRNPAGVILLDGIDAAHPAVRDMISTAMSSGMLTDARGRRVSFRNAVVVVTRLQREEGTSIGFSAKRSVDPTGMGVTGMDFDRILHVPMLDGDGAAEMIEARLNRIGTSYTISGVMLQVDQAVTDLIIREGGIRGGRVGDFASAYVELFETALFRTILPRRGVVMVRVRDDVVEVETVSEMAS